MRFPKEFPDKLRSTILVSEVVGKKVKLKAHGKEFQGLCPFHNEKTPSFTVNDQKAFYHCFGCAAHGDIISFVMNNDGLDYKDAVTKLANDFSIEIPKVTIDEARDAERSVKLERDYLILEKICQFFEKNLFTSSGKNALSYLQKRGITLATIKKFRLGFALNSYDNLINFLKSESFTDIEISKTGVISQNDQKKIYDKFRNRVIFPILDKKDRVIAFGGRTIADDLPKYLNSAETNLFKKSQTLYNFSFARKAIFTKASAVVVEGYMDAISLFTNGIENVVAGLGTALGQDHLKELFFTTDKIIICLDGDQAGIRAAKRVSELALPLINSKKNIAFAFLPNQLDPDDFIKEYGAKELEKILTNATPLSAALFEFALIELAIDKKEQISAESKAKIEQNLASKIEVITDNISKKYFSLFFKDLLFSLGKNMGKNTGKASGGNSNSNQKKSSNTSDNFANKIYIKSSKPNNLADSLAKNIVALIIKFPELANFRDESFDIKEAQFLSENLTNLKDLVVEIIENSELNQENIIKSLENSAKELDFSQNLAEIKNILASINDISLNSALAKFSILLLKDLLLQVDLQYREVLNKIDEIETHQSEMINQKIRELFDYKNSLELKILSLEKDLI